MTNDPINPLTHGTIRNVYPPPQKKKKKKKKRLTFKTSTHRTSPPVPYRLLWMQSEVIIRNSYTYQPFCYVSSTPHNDW